MYKIDKTIQFREWLSDNYIVAHTLVAVT